MSTYKIDRSRNISYVGKFKFDYEVVIGSASILEGGRFGSGVGDKYFYTTGGYFYFNFAGGEFEAFGVVANTAADESSKESANVGFFDNGWNGAISDFGPNEYDVVSKTGKVRFNFVLKTGNKFKIIDSFVLDVFKHDPFGDQETVVSGSVEGSVFYGMPLDEYVDIVEYYPSELTDPTPTSCGDNENWKLSEVNSSTVRKWPKYTTINWYEVADPTKKSTLGIQLFHTNSKNQKNVYSKSATVDSPFFPPSYICSKQFNAWNGTINNSGYCSISSNVPFSETEKNIFAKTSYAYIDFENFSLKVHPHATLGNTPKAVARFNIEAEPARKVTFEAVVKDWTQNYPDKLTAYIVGFGSTGYPTFSYNNAEYPEATYKTIESSSGIFNAGEQTYRYVAGYQLQAHDDSPEDSGYGFSKKPFYKLDNRQLWIHGVIDGDLAAEKFDTLDMPPSHYDFPDYWVNQGGQCVNINYPPQRRTIDGYALSGRPIPLPLRGWKFNAMSLKQDKEFKIDGSGNKRIYRGEAGNINYYGGLNLSGYRYLQVQLKSVSGNIENGTLEIIETAKGPTTGGGTWTENVKSWNVVSGSKDFANLRIDLCNPDNKIAYVDNQDSPYPRLNTYTTSKPKSAEVFGYLAEQNFPKDDFLVTKKSLTDSAKDWIKADTVKKIVSSGFVYLTDKNTGALDYFEVDKQRFPSIGGTNVIYGKPRVLNGKIKLAKPWNGSLQEATLFPDYRKTLYLYIPQNDITIGKSIESFIEKDAFGNYPNEYEIYNYDFGQPDISNIVSYLTQNFTDGSVNVFVNPIPAFNQNLTVPYDGILLEDSVSKKSKKYKIVDYISDPINSGLTYIIVEGSSNPDPTLVFKSGSTSVKLCFFSNDSDDKFRSVIIKFKNITKQSNIYKAELEYAKQLIGDQPNYDGIPLKNGNDYNFFTLDAPVVALSNPKLVEFTFPVDTPLKLNLVTNDPSGNEVNAIDDYPEDEVLNGPYYGISRANKIELISDKLELGEVKLVRDNSLSNFVNSGTNTVFESKTKFDVSSTLKTSYFTRRFWQQNTDGKDEEEGDIEWQHTVSENISNWTLFPKSISGLCDDINKIDEYVAPRWLDAGNPSGSVIRHPGWIATSVPKKQNIDPITGKVIFTRNLDPEYLNSETGYATWVLGNGLMALPSGKNTGSGTTYKLAIDISFNDLQNILAQTIFHRINGTFPPGKPDLFGNTSLLNQDGTTQESMLHLRGGMIVRGPGYGLILPPQASTKDNLRKANLIDTQDNSNAGSDESDSKGYFETGMPYGKNSHNNYIELEKSKNFPTPSDYRSSTRKMTQSKRERAAFKGGKENIATNLTACESGFEKSIVIAYTIPSTKDGEENQTAIIQTDSFFTQQYEKFAVGYNDISGTGVTLKGEYPFLIGSESYINQQDKINTFLLTERNSNTKSTSSKNYESLIAANTDMRNKNSWHPYIDSASKIDANFSTLSKAFTGTRFNSYLITDQATQLFNVGIADPGAILVRSVPLNVTNINAPITDKTIFIDGSAPTHISDFRLVDQISVSGTATTSFPTITQIASRDYLVAYTLNATPRTINYKTISNYQPLNRNILLDLDFMTGGNLDSKYNIYGLTSDYDDKLKLHRSVFWCNGGIYYFEFPISSSKTSDKRIDKIHLIKGKLDENLVTELSNRNNIVTYFNQDSALNVEVPRQRPALISCKKQEYDSKVMVAYDTGKCYIEAVLIQPYKTILGTRRFDIECVNDSGSTTQDKTPIADIQASPTSGNSALLVNFLSSNSYDPGGSTLTYAWNFGDDTQSTEENPSHTFVNTTSDPIEFTITLIVTNVNGVSSAPATIKITVNPAPINNFKPQAKFTVSPTVGDVALTVTFTDASIPVNDGSIIQQYQWDVGDGNSFLKLNSTPFTFEYTRAGTYTPKLIVIDNLGRLSDEYIGSQIIVNGVLNNPPSPSFKSQQTSYSPTLKVQFADTSADVEGPIVAWSWNFGDNETSESQNPEHIYALPGTYLVTLTITDSGGLQASVSGQIEVVPPGNNPPVANFTFSQQARKLIIDFSDISTDSDGNIVSWSWDFGDGSTDITQNPSHNYLIAGTYQVSLTVTDNNNKSNTVIKNVVVNSLVNQSPIITSLIGTQTSYKPLVAKFEEASSDPDGYITLWNWDFGDGQTFSTISSALKNPVHTYVNPGTYSVTLTVTDDGLPDGTNKKTASNTITFVVNPPPPNQPPVALFTVDANNISAPATINFTDQSSDTDGNIVSWFWEFETGYSTYLNAQSYQKTVTHTYRKSGTYTAKLTVTDNEGGVGVYALDIVVKNNLPIAILSAYPNPVVSQSQVSFYGNLSYDNDGSISKYSWDFGDGTIIDQGLSTENHIFNSPGTYKVTLTVTDNIGDTSSASVLITVTNRNPVAIISYSSLTVKAPGSLYFVGDGSYDIDGRIVLYQWTTSNGLTASTPNATFNFSTAGNYIITLTVTDDFGGTNSTSVNIEVTPPDNILPFAILNVDKNTGIITDSFNFDVSNSYDSDGFITLYKIDFGDNTSTQFTSPSIINHKYLSTGIYIAKLIVIDNRNGQSIETSQSIQQITINNQPPIADFAFSPINAFTFDPIVFTDNSSDPENNLSKWEWNFGDNTTFITSDPLQKSPSKSYNKGNKDYNVTLKVYDNLGLSSSLSKIVHINNRKPFAVITTDYTPTNNTIIGISPFTVLFDSASYDLDGTVQNYEWIISGLEPLPITLKSFAYTFNSPRFTPYVVTLRVQDDDGDWSDKASLGVKVNFPNQPPIANISANPQSNTGFAPLTVDFSGSGSYDPDNIGSTLIYNWDLGNGSVSSLVNPTTSYTSSGTYKVVLTVTDSQGATGTASLDYIVKNNKPVALIDTVPSGIAQVLLNYDITFTSAASYDSDANQFINGYKWLVDGVDVNSNTPTLTTSFNSVGNHTVTLSVFDNLGLESDPVSKTIYVFTTPPPKNNNPIAVLNNEPGPSGYIELKVGDSTTLDGSQSYDIEDGTNITFEWRIDGVLVGTSSSLTYQFNQIGLFTVNLTVFDTLNLSSTPASNLNNRYEIQVNVSDAPNPLATKVFSSGRATFGAIASGSISPDRYGFELVDGSKQYTIIESGLNHSFVVDINGNLYASGSNANGQLGFPQNITQINSLTKVPLSLNYKVLKVSAGDNCSAIIVQDILLMKKVLLVCGNNANGAFGNNLPKTNIFNFTPIVEKPDTANNLIDVDVNSFITAYADNKQIWVSGTHNYINKTGINENGFFPINIDPNPDVYFNSINYLNPLKIEVGSNNLFGFVVGLGLDIDNQIVWFTGLTSLRGWGFAYDISCYENRIVVITASQDPYFDHAIYLYNFSSSEVPQYDFSAGLASDLNIGENFLKVSVGKFGYLALSENLFYPYGMNDYGQLGYVQSISSSFYINNRDGISSGVVLPNMSVKGISDIAAGGDQSIIIASNIIPSTYSFTITKPNSYPNIENLTSYPINQIAG